MGERRSEGDIKEKQGQLIDLKERMMAYEASASQVERNLDKESIQEEKILSKQSSIRQA